jgi:glutathione S-transferase
MALLRTGERHVGDRRGAFRISTGRDTAGLTGRLRVPEQALAVLEEHLQCRDSVVATSPTIADVGLFAYVHVAPDVGLDLGRFPAITRWLERIRSLPHFIDDYVPYPENARAGASRSIYD